MKRGKAETARFMHMSSVCWEAHGTEGVGAADGAAGPGPPRSSKEQQAVTG